jgi:hypothetical protein
MVGSYAPAAGGDMVAVAFPLAKIALDDIVIPSQYRLLSPIIMPAYRILP